MFKCAGFLAIDKLKFVGMRFLPSPDLLIMFTVFLLIVFMLWIGDLQFGHMLQFDFIGLNYETQPVMF